MEELQPEELEELEQELRGESEEEEEALSPEVELQLRYLEQAKSGTTRLRAAERLGKLRESSPRIVQSLIAAGESDSSLGVREAAMESLRAPVHQVYVRRYPDLLEATEDILQELRVLQRSRDERPRRSKKRRRRPKTTTEQPATQREEQAAAAESALQQDLDLREMARGASIQRRIYPRLRIQESSPVAQIVGLVIAVGGIAGIVAVALPVYKSDCCSAFFVTAVCGGFVYGGFAGMGLDLVEIIRALLHRREWRGPQATADGRIVDLESKESRFEGEFFVTYWATIAFSGTGSLVYLKTTVDQSIFRLLRRGDPVKVRYAVENPRLAILEWESGW